MLCFYGGPLQIWGSLSVQFPSLLLCPVSSSHLGLLRLLALLPQSRETDYPSLLYLLETLIGPQNWWSFTNIYVHILGGWMTLYQVILLVWVYQTCLPDTRTSVAIQKLFVKRITSALLPLRILPSLTDCPSHPGNCKQLSRWILGPEYCQETKVVFLIVSLSPDL